MKTLMMKVAIPPLTLLLLCAQAAASPQEAPALRTRVVKAVEAHEYSWKLEESSFTANKEEPKFDLIHLVWERFGSYMGVHMFAFTSEEEASTFLRGLKNDGDLIVPRRKIVETLPPASADEGYVWEGFERNKGMYGQILRKGKVLLYITTNSAAVAERFALVILNAVTGEEGDKQRGRVGTRRREHCSMQVAQQ